MGTIMSTTSIFTKFVEAGRLVRITEGTYHNRIAVIVDIVNLKRVIIDGPTTGVPRQMITVRRIELLNQLTDVPRFALTEEVKTFMEKKENVELLASAKNSFSVRSREGLKVIQQMTDFERFKYERAVKKLKAERVKLAGL